MQIVVGVAAILLGSAFAPEPADCFDLAVVGELKRQIFIGAPASAAVRAKGEFAWDLTVKEPVVGHPGLRRLRLRVYQDTGLPRRYWDGVMVFAKRRPGQAPLAVRWAPADLAADQANWPAQVEAQAKVFGLSRCAP